MADATLPNGTYIRYRDEQGLRRYARIVGTDMGRTKYKLAGRVGGWGEWLWVEAGNWISASRAEVVTAEEAEAIVVMEME
jgi:hypothetical protein